MGEVICPECSEENITVKFEGYAKVKKKEDYDVTVGELGVDPVSYYCLTCEHEWELNKDKVWRF